MQRIQNLILILLVMFAACGKGKRNEPEIEAFPDITIEITNETGSTLNLSYDNLFLSFFFEQEEETVTTYEKKISGFGLECEGFKTNLNQNETVKIPVLSQNGAEEVPVKINDSIIDDTVALIRKNKRMFAKLEIENQKYAVVTTVSQPLNLTKQAKSKEKPKLVFKVPIKNLSKNH